MVAIKVEGRSGRSKCVFVMFVVEKEKTSIVGSQLVSYGFRYANASKIIEISKFKLSRNAYLANYFVRKKNEKNNT